jgi:hypothetical protein
MNASSVAAAIGPFARRRRMRDAIRGVCVGGWCGAAVFAASLVVGRFVAFPSVVVGVAVALLSGAVGGMIGMRRSPNAAAMCSLLDADLGLMERLRTAYEMELRGAMSPFAELQRGDALARLSATTPQAWLPRRFPRCVWTVPVVYAVACVPLLVPLSDSRAVPADASERVAVRRVVDALRKSSRHPVVRQSLAELAEAQNAHDALIALADVERRLKATSPTTDALATAREFIRAGVSNDAASLADALDAASPTVSSALRDELLALREGLSRNAASESLVAALEGIETREVSAETLERIVAALRDLENQSDADLLAALDEIRAQKKAIAAVALESRRGTTARLDATPGQESDDSEAAGRHLAARRRSSDAGFLALDAAVSSVGRESRVFSEMRTKPSANARRWMPFREVALASRQEAERAIRDESLPVAYRTSIAAYFSALNRATHSESPRKEPP